MATDILGDKNTEYGFGTLDATFIYITYQLSYTFPFQSITFSLFMINRRSIHYYHLVAISSIILYTHFDLVSVVPLPDSSISSLQMKIITE